MDSRNFMQGYGSIKPGSYFVLAILLSITACTDKTDKIPVGVKFNAETITRKGHFGDNWCHTWAADDHIYCMLDDGNGWWGKKEKTKDLYDWSGSMCLQIQGNEDVKEWTAGHTAQPTPLFMHTAQSV
jgi:hypothetical protein